jgi:universal stress protein A
MKPTKAGSGRSGPAPSRGRKTRPQGVRSNPSATPTRILVPIDFSPPSLRALRTAADFARQYGGRITLLHVHEPPSLPRLSTYPSVVKLGIQMTQLETKLSELGRAQLDTAHFDTARIESGKPFEVIVAAARRFKTDLIIIATHGFTGLKHVLLGSTAERVIRLAPCPILTVREDQRQGWPMAGR